MSARSTSTAVPKRLGVIGAGVIGLELGSVWKRLGSEVTILEALPDFLAAVDADSRQGRRAEFKKQGLDIKLGAKVSKAEIKGDEVHLTYTDAKRRTEPGRRQAAGGRRPSCRDQGPAGRRHRREARSSAAVIEVDEHCPTGVEGVWAVGDCVRGPMLAHKGFEEGIAVAELIAGLPGHVNLDTDSLGDLHRAGNRLGRQDRDSSCKAEGIPYKTGTFPFAAIGRAVAMNEPAGFVKVIAHAETDRILGMHWSASSVSELVHEGVVAMEFHGSAEDLARICHAHPTMSEAIHEAALAVDKRAIHKAN